MTYNYDGTRPSFCNWQCNQCNMMASSAGTRTTCEVLRPEDSEYDMLQTSKKIYNTASNTKTLCSSVNVVQSDEEIWADSLHRLHGQISTQVLCVRSAHRESKTVPKEGKITKWNIQPWQQTLDYSHKISTIPPTHNHFNCHFPDNNSKKCSSRVDLHWKKLRDTWLFLWPANHNAGQQHAGKSRHQGC